MHKTEKNLSTLIHELNRLNIRIGVKDGNLHINAPKGAINDRLRGELVDYKEELIDYFRGPAVSLAFGEGKIESVSRENMTMLPLSYSQEGIWFLEKLNPDTASYHIPFGIEFIGQIRAEIILESLRWLVNRHESLRTQFAEHNNMPHPVILQDVEIPYDEVDLTNIPASDREYVWGQRLRDFLHSPFNLESAPLFRVALIKLEPNRSHLVLNFHHIVADGWSLGVIMQELADAYKAFLSGLMPTAEPLKIQFVDYAVWQKEQLGMLSPGNERLKFWKDHLEGAPAVISLPTDRPRLKEASVAGGIINFRVNQDISAGIYQLAKRENVTPFMVFLSAFYILMSRYSRQEDIVVGTPIANRPQEEFEKIVGFFANTLALRSKVDLNESFLSYLKKVRQITLEGFDNQDVPFEMVVDHLQPERSSAWNPLYQVMFALQNNQLEWPEISGLETRFLNHFAMENSRLDLFFEMWEEGDHVIGQVEYNSHLFDIMSVRRMIAHFVTLLNGIVRMPSVKIAELPLMLPDERNQIVYEWNRTEFPFAHEALLNELFELQVRRSGERVAIHDPMNQINYSWRELNQKANQLAHFLKSQGAGKGSLIGISIPRSADMIVAVLAIVKTGGAWLPLDPEYPADRLRLIIEDAQPDVIVAQGIDLALFADTGVSTIDLQAAESEIGACSDKNVPSEISSDSPLYVLYTSGSTGRPKGVVGHHKGTINRFSWMWNKYPFTSGEICVQKTTLNFVDSVWEIFGPLLKGITLVVAPDEIVADPQAFIPFLADHSVTRIVLVPSVLQAMLDFEPDLGEKLPKLQMWTTSGETLSVKLYNQLLTAHPYVRLLNIYGSSEVAADVTCLDTSQYPTPDQMYIGKAIDNTKVYILDSLMEPVPIGVPGELFIAGPGVSLGYHNQPELTKERFLDNPFEPDSIVFKTGDIARYNADGQIEYMGRSDFQLKIRGVRIEPAEVELALTNHPEIHEAIVGEWEDELVAWFKLADGVKVSPDMSALRLFLSEQLPSYMIPSRFVNLPKVPRTPNGKIDRGQLPEPTLDIYRTELPYTPPSDEVEETLAKIWKQVLSVQKVSIFDDFFDLGGQSIMAVQMFGRIRDEFGANLTLSQLFVSSTIASLAGVIRNLDLPKVTPAESQNQVAEVSSEQEAIDGFQYLVAINSGADQHIPFYCVHGAGGNVLFFQKWKKHLKDYSFCAFQARGIDGITAPHESIVEMAADYLKELLKVNPTGPWILGGYSGGGVVALEMAIQLQSMGFELPPVIMLDTFHPHVQPRNYTMKDRVHLLATNPVDYVKSVAQKRVTSNFKKEYTREELDEMMATGTPLPIELRDDFMTDQFAKLLEQYPKLVPFDGEVILLCAKEIWHMFAHAGYERGWQDVLTKLTVHEVPGDHFTIIEEPAVLELLAKLKQGIAKLSDRSKV